ncbi:hypothetical protein Cni_G13343 [Canna indica]|uniref:C3H1-type domain-containing protein n=1 Tax=Canna indica TaxID=4628 RepID=A0AAQ3QCL5_9LILI|nr:hypothetical protein Cni_G13343 [Canna indica]
MCGGHRRPSPPPPTSALAVGDGDVKRGSMDAAALLLELAASDDLLAFKRAVEDDGLPLDAAAPWYCRSSGGGMGYQMRTPLMIAALYGSTAVIGYILSSRSAQTARHAASDGVTSLHCAASGGSPASLEAVKLLLHASPDMIDAIDASGKRPGDVIARQFSTTTVNSLEVMLKTPSCPRVPSPGREEDSKQGEKKEYPVDLTLPDINSGIYGTDEFRMYAFKIKPCSRAYSHDWTECPFAHPGENARRRDPRKHSYSCVPCPEFRKGSCRNGDACEYAHGVFESWLHPAQYRTRLCKDEIGCNRRVCFFAHKREELRTVNPSAASIAGTVMPSPKSSPPGFSSIDMATALMLMQKPSPPQSTQTSSAMTPPALHLPSRKLKASLSSRDMDVDLDLLGLEAYQQNLLDDIRRTTSPRAKWGTNNAATALAATGASEYNHLMGSSDSSLLSHRQGISAKQAGLMQQSQLLSGYGSSRPSSQHPVSSASSLGLDHSTAKAIMNSRAAAFAKRSLSFCDRGATASRQSTLSAMTTVAAAAAPETLFSWGSPDGKLDWSVQGDELNKLKKSASFAYRSNQQANHVGIASATAATASNEPDFSWVQSMVKDRPAIPVGRVGTGKQQNGYGGNFISSEIFSPWAEEQILA